MPLSNDRALIQISIKAYKHLQRIKVLRKRLGLSYSITGYLSDLILEQPLPTINNGKAYIVGQDQPVPVKAIEAITGELSGVMVGQSAQEVKS